jgi:hypothetical protein
MPPQVTLARVQTVMMIVFFCFWAFTEIQEMGDQQRFEEAFKQFHDEGARFTAGDGAVLKDELDRVEAIAIAAAVSNASVQSKIKVNVGVPLEKESNGFLIYDPKDGSYFDLEEMQEHLD